MENAHDEDLKNFYAQKKYPPILGENQFIANIKKHINAHGREISRRDLGSMVSMTFVIDKVSDYFNLLPKDIVSTERGAGKKNTPRRIAMHLCQHHTGATLTEIAQQFNVAHYSTVSQTIKRLLHSKKDDVIIQRAINVLSQDLTP